MESFLKCRNCSQSYNLNDRLPYQLYPCGHTACKSCVNEIQNDGNLCRQNHKSPIEVKDFVIFRSLVEQLQNNFGIIIHCGEHPQAAASFFWKDMNSYICAQCASFHQDKSKLVYLEEDNLSRIGECMLKYAEGIQSKLTKYIQIGSEMHNKLKSQKGDTIFYDITDSLRFFRKLNIDIDEEVFKHFLDEIREEEELLQLLKDPIPQEMMESENSKENVETQTNVQLADPGTYSLQQFEYQIMFTLKNLSCICRRNPDYSGLLNKWIDQRFKIQSLLFQSTVHGFNAETFHEKCDNKGPTLTIIETDEDFAFGGFTSKSWKSPNTPQNEVDTDAFIFSLTRQTKHPIKEEKIEDAIRHRRLHFMAFGNASDLNVFYELGHSFKSSSNIGYAYEPPQGIKYNTEKSKSYLGGKYRFIAKEIEIFQLEEI